MNARRRPVLAQLHAVRSSRLAILREDWLTKFAALCAAEQDVRACEAELDQVRQQRLSWESEWQSWLRTHGVLSRGEDYSRYHVALSAWERDVREQLRELEWQRITAEQAANASRVVFAHAQRKLDALAECLHDCERAERRRHVARESRCDAADAASARVHP